MPGYVGGAGVGSTWIEEEVILIRFELSNDTLIRVIKVYMYVCTFEVAGVLADR